jgi:chorismate-pyruvate lyase
MTMPQPTGSRFDPLGDLLATRGARPAGMAAVNLRALTPFQRALLVMDGTVTKFVEAYTMEPIEVVRLSQEAHELGAEDPWLEAGAGEPVVRREVLLRGGYSRTLYAYAVSVIVPGRLPAEVLADLEEAGSGGLGRILLDQRLETRREVLWYGRERLDPLPEQVGSGVGDEFVSRTYRIIADGRPIMLISEKFPYHMEGLPAHD